MDALIVAWLLALLFLAATLLYEVFSTQFYLLTHGPIIGYAPVCDFSKPVRWCK